MDKQKANEAYADKLAERRRLQKKRTEQMLTKRAIAKRQRMAGAAYEESFLTAGLGIAELLFGEAGDIGSV